MIVIRKVPFEHNGKSYEIMVSATGDGLEVRALHDGRPANGFRYSVAFETEIDLAVFTGERALDHLVQLAIDDVRADRWGQWLKLLGGG